jgi:putrescine transport system permease protein
LIAKKSGLNKLLVLLPSYSWLVVFCLMPLLLVFCISFSGTVDGIPPYQLFFGHDETGQFVFKPVYDSYNLLFTDSLYFRAYLTSLKIAAISTFFILIIAYPIAYGIVRAPQDWRNFLLLLVIIPFWSSLLIRVYAWITILKGNGLLNQWLMSFHIISEPLVIMNTQTAVIIGIVYSYLPFMILPLYSALEKINPQLLEAATDLGCPPFSAFVQITLPLSIPGIIAGSMLVFIPAVGEFVIPDLLGGSQIMTIGKVLWNEFFLNRDWPTAAAVTTIMTFIIILPIVFVQRMIGKKEE